MHLQNFEKLQSQKIASRCRDILRREKSLAGSRVFAFGEDSRALRLPSELGDLRAANADLHSVPQAAQNRAKPRLPQPQQKPPDWVAFVVAGVAGFGPTNARVKVWCLTAWLYPIDIIFYINAPIIPYYCVIVKYFLLLFKKIFFSKGGNAMWRFLQKKPNKISLPYPNARYLVPRICCRTCTRLQAVR